MLRTMAEVTLAETDIDGLIPHWRRLSPRRSGAAIAHSDKPERVC